MPNIAVSPSRQLRNHHPILVECLAERLFSKTYPLVNMRRQHRFAVGIPHPSSSQSHNAHPSGSRIVPTSVASRLLTMPFSPCSLSDATLQLGTRMAVNDCRMGGRYAGRRIRGRAETMDLGAAIVVATVVERLGGEDWPDVGRSGGRIVVGTGRGLPEITRTDEATMNLTRGCSAGGNSLRFFKRLGWLDRNGVP